MLLRGYRDGDADRVQQACSDERTQYWLRDMPSPYTFDDARAYLETRTEQLAGGTGITWAIADPESDGLLGTISLFDLKPGFEAEIGYWAHPEARGRGVMTEACGLVDPPRVHPRRGRRTRAAGGSRSWPAWRTPRRAG